MEWDMDVVTVIPPTLKILRVICMWLSLMFWTIPSACTWFSCNSRSCRDGLRLCPARSKVQQSCTVRYKATICTERTQVHTTFRRKVVKGDCVRRWRRHPSNGSWNDVSKVAAIWMRWESSQSDDGCTARGRSKGITCGDQWTYAKKHLPHLEVHVKW